MIFKLVRQQLNENFDTTDSLGTRGVVAYFSYTF